MPLGGCFEREYGGAAGQQLEAAMTRRALFLSLTLIVAAAGGAAAGPSTEAEFAVAEGGFVLDGGDLEAAALAEGSCLDPSLAEELGAAPEPRPSLAASPSPALDPQAAPAPRPMAFEYSDGYRTRLKIHKYASFATLPLFIAQFAVGQKLYDGNASDSTRSAHTALAVSTAALFGVNTVTGIWNLSEGRKDPNHRTKRMVHGILMAIADAGFVATGVTAPESEGGEGGFEGEGDGGNKSTHRTVALASMGIATVAYLMMLIH
jgi:hypothetical protein